MRRKIFEAGKRPGMGEAMSAELEKSGNMPVVFLTRGSVYSPGMAAMLAHVHRDQAAAAAKFDPNAPMMELITELQELSNGNVPDSVFSVPEGYAPIELHEILKSAIGQFSVSPQPGSVSKQLR